MQHAQLWETLRYVREAKTGRFLGQDHCWNSAMQIILIFLACLCEGGTFYLPSSRLRDPTLVPGQSGSRLKRDLFSHRNTSSRLHQDKIVLKLKKSAALRCFFKVVNNNRTFWVM